MLIEGRKREILELLYEQGRASVAELSKKLYVSEMTVRRDLTELERSGYIKRYRGGAVFKKLREQTPISERFLLDKDEKVELCRLCEPYLKDNTTVFIDSSSTCQYLIPHIAGRKGISIVTNSVRALLLAAEMHVPCILLGGDYYEQDMCLVGPLAQNYAEGINVDVAFFTTAAIDSDGRITDFDIRQTMIRKIIMKNAATNVFMFERSKLNKRLLYTLCEKDEATAIITVDNVF